MKDVFSDAVYVTTMPGFDGQRVEPVEVLMIAVDEQQGVPSVRKNIQPVSVCLIFLPEQTEVSKHDDEVVARHLFLLWEGAGAEFVNIDRDMGVAGQVDHGISPLIVSFIMLVPPCYHS